MTSHAHPLPAATEVVKGDLIQPHPLAVPLQTLLPRRFLCLPVRVWCPDLSFAAAWPGQPGAGD